MTPHLLILRVQYTGPASGKLSKFKNFMQHTSSVVMESFNTITQTIRLNNEYIIKARNTDRQYCGTAQGTTGPVETKLATLGEVRGVVVGAFGEGSDDLHSLIHHLAISRVRVAGPQKGRRGQMRTEEAELALTTSFLSLSVVGVRAKTRLLLGRLEVIGLRATAVKLH